MLYKLDFVIELMVFFVCVTWRGNLGSNGIGNIANLYL